MISIIIPLYNEQENVSILVSEIVRVMEQEKKAFEIILIDDGSKDNTFKQICQITDKDNRVRGLRFRRNHGQTVALKAGIEHVKGDICITMDGDLQHNPDQIPEFLKKIDQGFDLVCSYRHKRNDSILRKIPSKIANFFARKLSKLELKDFGSTYRAYRTDIAKEMPIYGEMHRFIPVFMSMYTDRITEIPIHLKPRLHGRSNYGLGRTFRVFSDLLVLLFFAGFFTRPIHIFGYISILLGLPGFTILSGLSLGKFFFGLSILDNFGPLFVLGVLLCLVSGQMITTGIVCEYLIRIYYNDDKRKPYSIAASTDEIKSA